MELRVLRYFLAVAKEENISRAAEYLYVTQPTLSRQLMDLEYELGKKLFERGSRKITLTAEGILLRKRAEEIMDLVKKTAAEFLSSDEIISGDVYIGGGETEGMGFIARAARSMRETHPQVRFHIFSGDAEAVGERLDKGLLDFGVLIGRPNVNKYDFLPLPAADTWGVLMRRDSPLAVKDRLAPEDLYNEPLICSQQALASGALSGWFKRDFEKLNLAATYNLVYNASLLVESGLGYALCLDKLINTTGDSVFCFKPLEPPLTAPLDIVWKKYQVFSRAQTLFLERLQRAAEVDEKASAAYHDGSQS